MVANGRIGLYMGNGRSAISTRKLQMRDYNNQPPGGRGKLRALLEGLKEDQEKLDNHPIYKEGWDDGFQAAQAAHRKLTKSLARVYNINDWDDE
jgi:hypothetical protein